MVAESAPLVAILAAGGAKRFGGGKLDADCAGKAVGQWALDAVAAAGFAPGVIVVGAVAPQFALTSGWRLLVNPDASQGLGTSLSLAARHAMEAGRPLLVLLGDMPLVSPAHLAKLTESGALSATAYPGGRLGVPAFFPPAQLEKLARTSGDTGAGPLLAGRGDAAAIGPPEHMLLDVDTPQDLDLAAQYLRRG